MIGASLMSLGQEEPSDIWPKPAKLDEELDWVITAKLNAWDAGNVVSSSTATEWMEADISK